MLTSPTDFSSAIKAETCIGHYSCSCFIFLDGELQGIQYHRKLKITIVGNSETLYRIVQKTDTLCIVRLNFIKYRPIFKLISLSESGAHM